jgi:hypothetical protein
MGKIGSGTSPGGKRLALSLNRAGQRYDCDNIDVSRCPSLPRRWYC